MPPPHVLIVDDHPSLLLILCETFRSQGFQVSTAADGSTAIAEARRLRPDLLVLDVGLPERNGFEVCRALRDDPETAALPIVLLTARAADVDRHWGLDAGADEYLTKPFDPDQLVRTAREILSARRAGQSRNPLTKLPDFGSLARRLEMLRAGGADREVRLIEFEPEPAAVFRQKYGELAAARAIRLAAACLLEALEGGDDEDGMLGHAGDVSYSRFALAAEPGTVEAVLGRAVTLFRERIVTLYGPSDRARRAVIIRRPDGSAARVKLLELRVGGDGEFEREIEEAA